MGEKQLEVFISHKHEDEKMARVLSERLELYGAGRVSSFISQRIAPGNDWFEEIRKKLSTADALILLFTAEHAAWDWPLFEVGLATNIDDSQPCRIVCFHPPELEPPDPIKFAQAVKADENGIEEFLYKFFCTSEVTGCDPPLNQKLAENRDPLRELAAMVAGGFELVKPWATYFTNYLWIIVEDGKVESEHVPESAWIDPESTGLAMFQVARKPPNRDAWTWGDLLRKASRRSDEAWVSALGERFYYARRGEILKSMSDTFTCLRTGQSYIPLLNRAELRSDGSMLFEVILVEQQGREEVPRVTGPSEPDSHS
ncbi:MAG: toll/interleukin-1 receptor domain-containing protein [Planctomycetota bacterium]